MAERSNSGSTPGARSDVTALLTLRLSAAWSALCCICIAAGSGKAARSQEEIELVFDRNKGAIYALYTRAMRERADLQGKMVLQLTISPAGEVTDCTMLSSELNDPDLEHKIVARVKLFRFEPKDVEPITARKTIEFFPGQKFDDKLELKDQPTIDLIKQQLASFEKLIRKVTGK